MAFLLISLFLVFAVVGRVAVQWFRTGDSGLRTASLDAPLYEILPGGLFIVSFCAAFVLSLLGKLGKIIPVFELSPILLWLFFGLGMAGILIIVVSQHQMGDSWRIGVDQQETTALKTNGLYARTRNPIYFGLLLFWLGLCGTLLHPLILLTAAVCWVCIEVIVRKIEEPYLYKVHGDEFTNYVNRTNRYLPF